MKATLPRTQGTKSPKAKVAPRPSGVVLKQQGTANKSTAKPSKPARRAGDDAAAKKPAPSVRVSAPKVGPKTSAAPKPETPVKAQVVAKSVAAKPASAKPAPTKPAGFAKSATAAKSVGASQPSSSGKASLGKPVASKPAASKPAAPAVDSAPPPAKKPARKSIKEAAGVSTDAVARRTGKTWDDWFEVLDSAGAATLDQRGIVAILAQKHGIGPWWQQMIAVGYESLRGKAEKPVAVDGFQISQSCTLSAPVARVFKLWNDASERARWLADDRFVVKSATPGKVLRARWGKGTSHVAVSFVEKAGKTEVAVEHQQIESRAAADQMKAYWQKKLGLLDEALGPAR